MEPSPNDVEAYQKWVECMDRGAGELYLAIEDDQKHHLGGVLDNPRKMWELLKCRNQSKKPGTHFNAYDDLFSIRKQENESLENLIARVSEKVHSIKDL